MLFRKLLPLLVFGLKLHDLIARCGAAVMEFGVQSMSQGQERSLDVLLRTLESQATDLEAEAANSDDGQFYVAACRTLPVQTVFALMLASACLLRVLKGSVLSGLDVQRAKTSFFGAINLSRQMSVEQNNPAAKMATMFSQLWNSTTAFANLMAANILLVESAADSLQVS
ncbi:uncharacterized protein ATNIH1004_004195 [Aspergillus tanneri]|uniref:Uncharacterized protein n=1 Tax=Aspergillus tanneri TaxID=1220188 RepID=A0A5M9MSJ0_9EURO|nr:uncharacterized protein ATNIH1004_004195 [Aspergillus tanneri]KAA8648310.1 hypothetical protein ATNIH1004_004195 [Aspergillus tanneri]